MLSSQNQLVDEKQKTLEKFIAYAARQVHIGKHHQTQLEVIASDPTLGFDEKWDLLLFHFRSMNLPHIQQMQQLVQFLSGKETYGYPFTAAGYRDFASSIHFDRPPTPSNKPSVIPTSPITSRTPMTARSTLGIGFRPTALPPLSAQRPPRPMPSRSPLAEPPQANVTAMQQTIATLSEQLAAAKSENQRLSHSLIAREQNLKTLQAITLRLFNQIQESRSALTQLQGRAEIANRIHAALPALAERYEEIYRALADSLFPAEEEQRQRELARMKLMQENLTSLANLVHDHSQTKHEASLPESVQNLMANTPRQLRPLLSPASASLLASPGLRPHSATTPSHSPIHRFETSHCNKP
jgi:hypothetical protein